jgi:energy-coupling factor transporter ATP-binding protein EcfA2
VVATHELEIVRRYGKRTVRLDGGRIVEQSQPRVART